MQRAAVRQQHTHGCAEPLTIAGNAMQFQGKPMIIRAGDVVKKLGRSIQDSDDRVKLAIIVEIGKSDAPMKSSLLKVGSDAGGYIFKTLATYVAKYAVG